MPKRTSEEQAKSLVEPRPIRVDHTGPEVELCRTDSSQESPDCSEERRGPGWETSRLKNDRGTQNWTVLHHKHCGSGTRSSDPSRRRPRSGRWCRRPRRAATAGRRSAAATARTRRAEWGSCRSPWRPESRTRLTPTRTDEDVSEQDILYLYSPQCNNLCSEIWMKHLKCEKFCTVLTFIPNTTNTTTIYSFFPLFQIYHAEAVRPTTCCVRGWCRQG